MMETLTEDTALDALWMPFTANRAFKQAPRLLVTAKDMHYTADDGRRILDGTAGLWCVNAGHCREPITAAIPPGISDTCRLGTDIGQNFQPITAMERHAVVRTRCSSCIRPASSSTQYQLLRSPRSSPMVSFCCEIFLPCFATAVLTFFIAGLLFICALSTSITWERTASRPETGLLIPSVSNNHHTKTLEPATLFAYTC